MTMCKNACLCLLLVAVACAKTTSPLQGTNTNWLTACDSEADCDAEDACLCGVCTQPCTEDDQCGAVNAATSCEPLVEAACGASSASMSACLQGCEEDGDCTALEDGRCTSGVCVPEALNVADASTQDASTQDASTQDASTQDASMTLPDSGLDPTFALLDGTRVVIPEAYTPCSEHYQCSIVSTDCAGCCAQGVINIDHSSAYEAAFAATCADVEFRPCECDPLLLVAACREERCVALDAFDDCFSPTQNLDIVSVDEARGCDCTNVGQSICVAGNGLICEGLDSNPPQQRWAAVLDGPCGEPTPDPTCPDGEVRATAEACLADFMTCYEIADGEYCGLNP
jgi:hypothetical protein